MQERGKNKENEDNTKIKKRVKRNDNLKKMVGYKKERNEKKRDAEKETFFSFLPIPS